MKVEISPNATSSGASYRGKFTEREQGLLEDRFPDSDERRARIDFAKNEALLAGAKVCVLGSCALKGEITSTVDQDATGFTVSCEADGCHRKPVLSAGAVIESEIARLTS